MGGSGQSRLRLVTVLERYRYRLDPKELAELGMDVVIRPHAFGNSRLGGQPEWRHDDEEGLAVRVRVESI